MHVTLKMIPLCYYFSAAEKKGIPREDPGHDLLFRHHNSCSHDVAKDLLQYCFAEAEAKERFEIQDETYSSVTTPFSHITLKPTDTPGLVAQPEGEDWRDASSLVRLSKGLPAHTRRYRNTDLD